jgi:hypothetical protein
MSAARMPVQPAGARVVIRLAQTLAVGALAFLVLALAPGSARAQEPIDSTTELKRACEAGSHFIYVTTDVKITAGPQQTVASGCQIALGPAASFEATGVSMSFAGPFRIDSSRERSVTFTNSTWKATSLGLYVDGAASFKSLASLLQATAGKIEIGTGSESLVQVQSHQAGSANALKAAGSVVIYGGEKLFVDLTDTGIEGRRGVRINLGGNESALKAESAQLRSPGGPVSVSAASKALVELNHVGLGAGRGNATISLDGPQSVLKTAFTTISSQGGSVDLLAGRHGAWTGAVELFESTVTATGGVRVQGSPEGQEGTVKVSSSTFSGGSDVVFRSGTRGTTDVKESRISSATAIRIRTGMLGSCKAESNTYNAPVRQICP